MEGYVNVDNSHEDFDDLDIEGRNARKRNTSIYEEALEIKTHERRLLSLRVKVDDNTYGYVFSLNSSGGGPRWKCHLCDVSIVTQEYVDTHIQSKKHQLKLALPLHPQYIFKRIESSPSDKNAEEIPELAPGEPVPPGFEDVVRRVAQIQTTLDSYKKSALIGLEYLVELTPDERGKEPLYVCMLCSKKGDPRVAMAHITSYNHCLKYISIYFPAAYRLLYTEYPRTKDSKKLTHLAMKHLCSKIEEQYGRLKPVVVDKDFFEKNKNVIGTEIENDKHFRETPTANFLEYLTREIVESLVDPFDVPLPEENPSTEDQKSTFIKGKITCDRSRLRTRNSEEGDEEDVFKKLAELEKKAEESAKLDQKASEEPGVKRQKTEEESPKKKSLSSVSSISSSSLSQSRSRSRSKSWSRLRSRHDHKKYDRYRRISGRSRRSRSRSWSSSKRSTSRTRRSRSRSRSRDSKGRRWHQRSRSPPYRRKSPYRDGRGQISRSKYQDKRKDDHDDRRNDEKNKWVRFRQELDKVEREMSKQLKYHEKNPEKHPLYPDEWKKFWNRRYKELQADNKDPSKHDFKPEWIEFWNKRVKDLYKEEIKAKKEEWKIKLGLPEEEEKRGKYHPKKDLHSMPDDDVIIISPPSENDRFKKDVTVADIKNTWKALTGSEIKDSRKRSQSPWEEQESSREISSRGSPLHSGRWWQDHPNKFGSGGSNWRDRGMRSRFHFSEDTNVVGVLRLLTAMENQLGSLGPRVNTLLAQSLALEKSSPGFSQNLLEDADNVVLLETVREKLRGQLLAGIVPRTMVTASRSCIHKLTELLSRLERTNSEIKVTPSVSQDKKMTKEFDSEKDLVSAVTAEHNSSTVPAAEPVAVPGVGVVDKVAIAQQIAAALVAQGKTNVSQEELQQLINAVVGMAQASADNEEPMTAAASVAQQQQNMKLEDQNLSHLSGSGTPKRNDESSLELLLSTVVSGSGAAKIIEPRVSALQLLQSAYDEKRASPSRKSASEVVKFGERSIASDRVNYFSRTENMDGLSEDDLKTLLQNFKDLPPDEQQCLITYLKSIEEKDPDRVERLRKYVNLGQFETKSCDTVKSRAYSPPPSKLEGTGHLSPFSMRLGGINPSQDDRGKRETSNESFVPVQRSIMDSSSKIDDSDDDYSFEDIYAAASRKVKEREKAKEAEEMMKSQTNDSIKKVEDSKAILRETKEIIANLMGQLPGKFIQKPKTPDKDSPVHPNLKINITPDSVNIQQQITTVSSANKISPEESGRPVPILDSSTRARQLQPRHYPQQQSFVTNYETNPTYGNHYSNQSSYQVQPEGYQQTVPNYPNSGNYNEGFTNYYNNQQPQYSQPLSGQYSNSYPDQTYTNQIHHSQFPPTGSGVYNQFPNQSTGYY